MRVTQSLPMKEAPEHLQTAVRRYANTFTDEQGHFEVVEVILIGRKVPHQPCNRHPHDDGTGFA